MKVGQVQGSKGVSRFCWKVSGMALDVLPGDPGLLAPLAAFVLLYNHQSEIRRAACTNGMEHQPQRSRSHEKL